MKDSSGDQPKQSHRKAGRARVDESVSDRPQL